MTPRHPSLAAAAALALSLGAAAADAHVAHGETLGFLSGFLHPVSGLDHVAAMVAVGLWGAQLGLPAIWLLPVGFPMAMAFGGFLGLIGAHIPYDEMAVAGSGVVLGACVLARARPPLWIALLLVGLFGLFHGYAHGVELPPGQSAATYSLGFVLATGLLHACGVALGLVHRWPWGRIAVRLAGVVIMGAGAWFLAGAVG